MCDKRARGFLVSKHIFWGRTFHMVYRKIGVAGFSPRGRGAPRGGGGRGDACGEKHVVVEAHQHEGVFIAPASETSISHVSDVVGPEAMVYAMEFSHRS
ncbi:unnamed protein product [Lepeophtheirus salmonis]|uniref:(salmon louse) hypothetical protein n=1 Tax=Lepeophtheirus salmonis TaxID=72036 RepID=A0A7R8CXK7_LEPSM|nr:unnamed protein product [Lepeophtheirus salmonis]CAF2961701.1 unnamed protein product [Lepeophtheirus salmonis]